MHVSLLLPFVVGSTQKCRRMTGLRESKKQDTKLLPIASPNVNQGRIQKYDLGGRKVVGSRPLPFP